MNPRARTSRAFTLLEMLAALSMTAVLAGSLYAILHSSFRARRSANEALDAPRRAEMTMTRIGADLRNAAVPNGILAGTFLGEDGQDVSGRPSDTLSMYCVTPAGSHEAGIGDIRLIQLVCQRDEATSRMVLVRLVTSNLLATTTQEPVQEVLCRGVLGFNLRYYDGTDWLDYWDSTTQGNQLPRAVEVLLEMERCEILPDDAPAQPPADVKGYFSARVFLIPCSSITTGTAVTPMGS